MTFYCQICRVPTKNVCSEGICCFSQKCNEEMYKRHKSFLAREILCAMTGDDYLPDVEKRKYKVVEALVRFL